MDQNKFIKQVGNALAKMVQERRDKQMKEDKAQLIDQINATIGPLLIPYLQKMVDNSAMHKGEMQEMMAAVMSDLRNGIKEALSNLKLDSIAADIKIPDINIPEIKIPEIKVPEPKVTINFDTSKIRIAPPVMPSEMKVTGSVRLDGVDLKHPLPVQLRDEEGNFVKLFENLTTLIGGQGGGGKGDYFTVKGFSQSAFSVPVNSDGEVKVAGTFTAGAPASTYVIPGNSEGVVYNGDNPLPVVITSGAGATTGSALVDSSGVQYSGSNPLPVTIASGAGATSASAIVDSTGVQYEGANPFPVAGTVAVSGITNTIGATILNGEGVARDSWSVSGIVSSIQAAMVDSSGVQYSGSNPVPFALRASDATNTMNVRVVDSGGVGYDGSNPFPIKQAGGTVSTLAANIVDSSGIGYSGSNPVPITWVSGSGGGATTAAVNVDSTGVAYEGANPMPVRLISGVDSSTVAVGSVSEGTTDDGANPIKVAGIVRTTNPSNHSDGQVSSASMDPQGRQLMRNLQVRNLINTAYVALTSGSGFGTETTLLAAQSGYYNELIWVLASNSSSAAVGIDIRAVTGGNILMHLEIPGNSTVGIATPGVPMFGAISDQSGNNWTVDAPDVTGGNVYITALFSKEV